MTKPLQDYGEDCLSPDYQEEWGIEKSPPFTTDHEHWRDWWGKYPAAKPEDSDELRWREAKLDPLRQRIPDETEADAALTQYRPAIVIDRGRGPEIVGTRITIYRIMDYPLDEYKLSEIASELRLTDEQLQVALDYIDEHRSEVELKYKLILDRVNQPNAQRVEEGQAKTLEELRQRIMDRRAREGAHDRPGRQ